MVRAMAKEAEASRERKAAMIRADGEYRSAIKLSQAAKVLADNDTAVELRRLQTLERIAKERNNTTLLVPMQVFNNADSTQSTVATGEDDIDFIDLDALEAQLLSEDKEQIELGYNSLGDIGRSA